MNDELIVLMTASNAQEARVIQAVLSAGGIPAVVEGDSLMDEWAMAQKLMGRIGAEVKVPASAREEALRILEEAQAGGVDLSAHAAAHPEAESPPRWDDEGPLVDDVRNPAWLALVRAFLIAFLVMFAVVLLWQLFG